MPTPRHRLERHTWGALSESERADLSVHCHALFSRWFEGISREAFVQRYLSSPDARLALLRNRSGLINGFSVVNRTVVDGVSGALVVFTAPVISEPGTGGGALISWFGLTEALWFKLRHPWTRLAYLGLTMTPAAYRVIARTMPRFYPAPHLTMPPGLIDEVGAVCKARGLSHAPGTFLAPGLRPRTASEQRANRSVMAHPEAAYFVSQNPNWTEGEALLVWIPLDVWNILGALPQALRHRRQAATAQTDEAASAHSIG